MSFALNAPATQNRKRNEVVTHLQHKDIATPIVLQTEASDPDSPNIELQPKFLIPRGHLPFTCTNRDQKHQPSYFRAWINALEELDVDAYGSVPYVLVAVSTSDNAFFAVERLRNGLYALCPLHNWTALNDTKDRPSKKARGTVALSDDIAAADAPWWDHAAITLSTTRSASTKQHPKPRLSVTLMLGASLGDVRSKDRVPLRSIDSKTDDDTRDLEVVGEAEVLSDTATVREEFRAKYLEALYISKTSLAYFAKGPLTRLRNALQQADVDRNRPSLSIVLQDMIMNVAVNDKKYATTLPDLLQEIPSGMTDGDQDMAKRTQIIRKRGRKRKKLSRGGLFPFEEETVIQWWLQKEEGLEASHVHSTHAGRAKRGLATQRTRETQLQTILILEAMVADAAQESDVQRGYPTDPNCLPKTVSESASKPKKLLNLQSLLDIHVDRLCIWQSTQNSFDGETLSLRPRSSHGQYQANTLQDFCTEVLVPFFAARMPQSFAQLCKKMGTIGIKSPMRSTTMRPPAKAQIQPRPGTAVSRRHLQRVATDGDIGFRKSVTLSRSATDTSIARMKREDDQVTLDDIPVHKPRAQPDLRHARREVDLDALTKATEAKMAHKALIEQELYNAINVLKKPNSRMAVKEYIDFSDGRAVGKSKRKREPMQYMPNLMPLVKATPRAKRVRAEYTREVKPDQSEEDIFVPPSSDQRAPVAEQSVATASVRQTQLSHVNSSGTIYEGTPSRRTSTLLSPRLRYQVDATPSKATLRKGRRPGSITTRGCMPDNGVTQQFSTKEVTDITERLPSVIVEYPSSSEQIQSGGLETIIAATPLKSKPALMSPREAPGAVRSPLNSDSDHEPKVSSTNALEADLDLYKALGWDDEDDVL